MASIDRVMALAEEIKKKKKDKNYQVSQSTINTLDLANDIQSGNKEALTTYLGNNKDFDAPIRTSKKKEEERSWFNKSGVFDDGYDFGDISKTLLGTYKDVKQDATKGVLRIGEGLVDTGAYIAGSVGKMFGADGFAQDTKDFIKRDFIEESKIANILVNTNNLDVTNMGLKLGKTTADYLTTKDKNVWAETLDEMMNEEFEEDSVLGDKSDSLVQSAGQLAGTIGLQAVGVPWWLTTGVTSFGGETQQAFQQDATYGEAGFSGLVSAGAEILTEKLSGGISFGGRTLDDFTIKPLINKISNKTVQTLLKFGVDAVGEGGEEVLTEVISNVGKKLSYEDDKTWGEMLTSEEAMDSYLEALIGGAVLGGGFNAGRVVSSLQTGRDYDTGFTANEQAVVDAEVAKRTEGQTLTNKQKAKIEAEVKEDLQKGFISTDTIESTLGGDTYNSLKSTRDNKTNLETQIKELESKPNAEITVKEMEQLNSLREQIKSVDTNTLETQLQAEMGDRIKSDGYLQRSYQEKAKRSQEFTYEAAETDSEFRRGVMESTKGKMNDTTRSHETAEALVKLSEDRKMQYKFTNNAELKQMGLTKEGKTANGLYVVEKDGKREILVNTDSKKYVEAVLVHETTHDFQNTSPETYTKLVDITKEFAEAQQDYARVYSEVAGMYKGVKDVNIQDEVTARLLEDYLGNKDFISSLTTKEPNIVKKIIDEVKYLVKKFTAGSPEARKLLELQHELEKTYREAYRQTKVKTETTEGTMYSVSEVDSLGRELSKEQMEFFKDSKIRDENGNLLVVYHGTRADFNTFDNTKTGDNYEGWSNSGKGFYFTDSKTEAQEYGDYSLGDTDTQIKEVYLNITNPFDTSKTYTSELDAMAKEYNIEEYYLERGDRLLSWFKQNKLDSTETLKKYGYDGVIDHGHYLAYEPNQIKNVDNTNPTGNSDIRYSLSEDASIDDKINSSMTMEDARKMIQIAFQENGIKDWYDGEYQNGDEWLNGVGADEVATYVENTESTIRNYLNPLYDKDSSYGEDYYVGSIIEAYQNGTLKGSKPQEAIRLDTTKENGYTDSRFYAPQNIEAGIELYEKANQRVTNSNRQEVYKARADFIIAAHQKGYAESIGLTQEDVNKKIKSWANYTKKAMELSNSVNEGVALQNRWSGIENSSIVNTISISNEDMAKMVKEVKGDSSGWQRQYITSTMLALDTHIDYSKLTFEFDMQRELAAESALGDYSRRTKTIRIGNGYQNTVAHEIGHYIDNKWAEDFGFLNTSNLTDGLNFDVIKTTDEIRQFNKNFQLFMDELVKSATVGGSTSTNYYQSRSEVFARFVGKFVEWTKNQATNNRYGYEDKYYKDNFTERQYREFIKLLQEKALIDTTNAEYSLSNESDVAPTSTSNQTSMQDIRLQVEEAIAPLSEQVSEQVDYSPAAQEVVEQQSTEAFNTLDDIDSPQQVEEFAPTGEKLTPTDSLFDTRDYAEVGNKNINAYQYDNPEVRPYFQQAAREMMSDLDASIRGERYIIGDNSQMGNGDYSYSGNTRHTTEDIAELLDGIDGKYKYSYAEIRKGLQAIIEDNGKENNAASKRIEFYLDKRLREGYTDVDGYTYPADEGYLDVLRAKGISDYYSSLPIGDAPVDNVSNTEVIAPVREQYEAIRPNRAAFNEAVRESAITIERDLGYVPKNPTQESSYDEIAEILTEEPTTENKRNNRKWAIIKANVFDKGLVFEDVSLKHKNRELMGKWDYTLTSEARAQTVIGNGHYEYDPYSKSQKQVSKSLNDIRAEVENTGLTKEFYEYIYHKHNVDRMNLEGRYEGMQNKPVFGNNVTAADSQEIVNQYEFSNPEFMDYAQDIYDYLNADRQQLVDNGVISQETADLWQEMYPHYVPIRRAGHTGNAINVPLDTGRTGVNAPIKKATGGSADILPLFDTMAMRTLQTYRATAKNSFGVELKNTIGTTINSQTTNIDEVIDSVDAQENLLQEGKAGQKPTFTVFENGEKITFEITEDMYDALKPLSDSSILSKTFAPLNVASSFHRGVLTQYNPVFMITNGIKDAQDILINSQHAAKTYAKVPEAFSQLLNKGYWYQEYMNNGGEQNSYFDSQENTFKTENTGIKKLLDLPPLKQIAQLNDFVERVPRLAEYIASREAGRSVEVSMLDAARVTTNFKAGGNLTKFLNRNGATFLNASVQGAMQQVRNVREANANGVRGWVNLATKFAVAGLPAALLNALLWKDDEEYEELSDYVKQNYYIVAKTDDGTFIRIPKGRTVAVIQDAIKQMQNLVTGDDEVDLAAFIDLVITNLAPSNPIESNIFAPIVQVTSNTTWYGEDLVPSRLQDLPAAEQYDESTDSFSRWLGEKTNISPVKINYLLDQYSGGLGDLVLPMLTPEAKSDADTLGEQMLAPLKSKFTTNAVMNNQNVTDFYEKSEELTTQAKKSNATDEDVLKNKFINAMKSDMNELYKQKREIQNSNLPNSEKYRQVLEVQERINWIAKAGLNNYEDLQVTENYATVSDISFRKNTKGEWTSVSQDELDAIEGLNMTMEDRNNYFAAKNDISNIVKEYKGIKDDLSDEDEEDFESTVSTLSGEKKVSIINAIKNSGLNDEQMAYLYDKYYASTEKLNVVVKTGIGMNSYLDLEAQNFTADVNSEGKTISGSKKAKIFEYINSTELGFEQRVIWAKMYYPSYDEYNYDIIDYLNNDESISYEDMVEILETLKFKVDDDGTISWD